MNEISNKKGRKEFNINDIGQSSPNGEKNLTPILNDFIKNKIKRVYNKKVELLKKETMRDRLNLKAPPTISNALSMNESLDSIDLTPNTLNLKENRITHE